MLFVHFERPFIPSHGLKEALRDVQVAPWPPRCNDPSCPRPSDRKQDVPKSRTLGACALRGNYKGKRHANASNSHR